MRHRKATMNNRRGLRNLIFLCLVLLLVSCVSDPAKVDVKLEESAPEVKVTSYTTALDKLGLMTEIYDTGLVKIQSQGIGDNTGTAGSTGGEIQRDITEIMKSTLNSIGGNIQFIEYDPAYIQNQMVTGYSDFSNKLVPDVVITGGITEFDRGLETRGDGTDVGAEANLTGMPGWLPSQTVGIDYGQSGKTGKAPHYPGLQPQGLSDPGGHQEDDHHQFHGGQQGHGQRGVRHHPLRAHLRPKGIGEKGSGPPQRGPAAGSGQHGSDGGQIPDAPPTGACLAKIPNRTKWSWTPWPNVSTRWTR